MINLVQPEEPIHVPYKIATYRTKSREATVATKINPSRRLKPIEELRRSPKDFKELLKKNDAKMIKQYAREIWKNMVNDEA